MSRKLSTILRESTLVEPHVTLRRVGFWCPGCRCPHFLPLEVLEWPSEQPYDGPLWRWNGDVNAPTFTPSVKCGHDRWVDPEDPATVIEARTTCHSLVAGGRIQFLDDSSGHLLRGTHDLPEFPHPEDGPPLLAVPQMFGSKPAPKVWRPA
jgi:hypothetical protein